MTRYPLRVLLTAFTLLAALLPSSRLQAQLVNTSVRVQVGTGADVLITGFVIGATPKTFLFRAVGPTLGAFGVGGTLADPVMTLYSGTTVVQTNDDWSSSASGAAIAQAAAASGAFALPANSRDSAMIATLNPGAYTVKIEGVAGGTGVALFEAYEVAAPSTTPPSTSVGTVRGIVRDGVTNTGISGVSLSFANANGAALGTATTGSTGEYSLNLPAGAATATLTYSGYVTTTLAATVVANSTIQADNVLFAQNLPGTGVLSGRITNALTGQALAGATLRLRTGVNNTTGATVATTTTGSSGDFTFSVNSGTYTCEVSATGFVTTSFVCVAVGGRTLSNQNYTISPVLSGNDLRIVLTWGSTPSDLDSHLTGPTTGSSRFHVYYASKTTTGVSLDVDDTNSYGPETITITQFLPGVYRYSVHDYSNAGSTSSSTMSNQSNAQVKVFQGSSLVATFNMPTGQTGTLWTVFEMDGTSRTITPKNQISNQSSSSTVPMLQDGAVAEPEVADAGIIRNLPPKK